MESDEKCFFCVPLEWGVKGIALLCIIKPPISSAIGLYTGAAPKEIIIPILMVELTGNLFFILVLGIKDNNTLWGRRIMAAGFFIVYIVIMRSVLYSMFFHEEVWGTTIPKVLCKGSTDPDCQMEKEKLLMTDFLGRLCFSFYITWMLYRYAK